MLRDARNQLLAYSCLMEFDDSNDNSLPLFPLNTVLLPGQVMPLHIFENRYKQLVSDLLTMGETEQKFGIVAITAGSETEGGIPKVAEVGTVAHLRKTTKANDGTFDIIVIGGERFEITRISELRAPYLVADIKTRPEIHPEFDEDTLVAAKEKCVDFMMMFDADNDNAVDKLPNDPSALSFLIAGFLPLSSNEQQKILEIDNSMQRLKSAMKVINRETILMQEIPSIPTPFLTRVKISPN